jgi:hypothetical protein
MRRVEMSSDEAAATDSTTGNTEPLPFDTSVAHQARVYDYLLGGKDNYAADRAAVAAYLNIDPELTFSAHANRAFLGRAVRYLAEQVGLRQFLDIGTGIPTAGNTHQGAQAIAPESRVVYVDYDRCKSGCAHSMLVVGVLSCRRSRSRSSRCRSRIASPTAPRSSVSGVLLDSHGLSFPACLVLLPEYRVIRVTSQYE